MLGCSQDPQLQVVLHLVETLRQMVLLRSKPGVAQRERRVCESDRGFLFSPTMSDAAASKTALSSVVKTFFNGSAAGAGCGTGAGAGPAVTPDVGPDAGPAAGLVAGVGAAGGTAAVGGVVGKGTKSRAKSGPRRTISAVMCRC